MEDKNFLKSAQVQRARRCRRSGDEDDDDDGEEAGVERGIRKKAEKGRYRTG